MKRHLHNIGKTTAKRGWRYSKSIWLLAILLLSFSSRLHSQLYFSAGGEIKYQFLRQVGAGEVKNIYLITVKLYKDFYDNSNLPQKLKLKIWMAWDAMATFPLLDSVEIYRTSQYISQQYQNSCVVPSYPLGYNVGIYSTEIALSTVPIMISVQGEWREPDAYLNVDTHDGSRLAPEPHAMGFTYSVEIPNANTDVPLSSSPVFKNEYPLILCTNDYFSYDFSAVDPDGDSLAYSFAPMYKGYDYTTSGVAGHPPFKELKYRNNFTVNKPLGPQVDIDPRTGIISGTVPMPGKYMVAVYADKYRQGRRISRQKREIQFVFKNCNMPRAQLDSSYKNCNGTTIRFRNLSSGPIGSYYWDFGDPSTNADTSNLREPVYTYPAPGVYTAKLFLNKNLSGCKDSATCSVIVDSGMQASFQVQRTPVCNQAIYNFTNNSTQGSIQNSTFAWDFGELSTVSDTSSFFQPSYHYPTEGNKKVRLIVGNDFGCFDTVFKIINIYKTLLHPPNDTVVCYLDTICLDAHTGYSGTYHWSPVYNISSVSDAAPLVSPDVPTTYYVQFTDSSGCTAVNSVFVDVRTHINLAVLTNDTTICGGDSLQLFVQHDGIATQWSPVQSLTQTQFSFANAHPTISTNYIITGVLGSCYNSDSVFVKVVPKPIVSINNDTAVCFGAPVYLSAGGGAFYTWYPQEGLSATNISNPVARPYRNIVYSVTVTDTLGCPKPVSKSVQIGAFRGLFALAGPDTMVLKGEIVQLYGAGGQYYQWSPPLYLNNTAIPNPVTTPYQDIRYLLQISNDSGCVDFDSVKIRVFNDPDIYVPTAFTPNGDGLNDVFRVFPVSFIMDDLKIFDRWGNLVFSTSHPSVGWNGKSKGIDLGSGVFVWIAKGRNKKTGEKIMRKGTVMLIR